MNPTKTDQEATFAVVNLNEKVLEAAAHMDGTAVAPEVPTGTAEITAWDEPEELTGHRVPEEPEDNDESITERLVSAGNEEADRELRASAAATMP